LSARLSAGDNLLKGEVTKRRKTTKEERIGREWDFAGPIPLNRGKGGLIRSIKFEPALRTTEHCGRRLGIHSEEKVSGVSENNLYKGLLHSRYIEPLRGREVLVSISG